MFQKTKQLCRKAFGFVNGIPTKVMMFSFMLLSGMVAKAQNSAGDYSAGTSALSTVADEIAKYVPIMVSATPLPALWPSWVQSRYISP